MNKATVAIVQSDQYAKQIDFTKWFCECTAKPNRQFENDLFLNMQMQLKKRCNFFSFFFFFAKKITNIFFNAYAFFLNSSKHRKYPIPNHGNEKPFLLIQF